MHRTAAVALAAMLPLPPLPRVREPLSATQKVAVAYASKQVVSKVGVRLSETAHHLLGPLLAVLTESVFSLLNLLLQ